MDRHRRAVVLLSGGLDSTTTLATAQSEGFEAYAITFRYGQRHAVELAAAERIATQFGVKKHITVDIDLRQFGGSALTSSLAVPKDRSVDEMGAGIPVTYVPARNTIFLSLALAYAEVLSAFDIFIGVNSVDYSGYPDCRPEFISAFEDLANLATKAGVEKTGRFRIHTPLIHLTKAEIIRKGLELGVDYSLTSTCYAPDPITGVACSTCDACVIRLHGFAEVGKVDPVAYHTV
jgi:7-cyano-7-deazaguanine synthase